MTTSTKAPDREEQGERGLEALVMNLVRHVQANPYQYLGSIGFIVAVLLFTGFYRLATESSSREMSTEFARAVLVEDPAERAAALATVSEKKNRLAPRALYLQGEALISALQYDDAVIAFTELRETYPDFEFVPDAVEGLGFVEEDRGNTRAALAMYQEVLEKWPDTPAGRRQPLNIARCMEETGDFAAAIQSYRDQLTVFPGSVVAFESQQRLTELRGTHPALFESDLAVEEADTGEESPETTGDTESATVE